MRPSFTDMLNISRAGIESRLENMDIISNNIANFNTTAYKSNRGNFQELLDEVSQKKGVRLPSTQRSWELGTYKESDNPLHMAIRGEGFFAVTLEDGTKAYTRDGLFGLDKNRRIVDQNGYPLVWSGTLPEGTEKIEINEYGEVRVLIGGKWSQAGTIQLSRFPNANGLTPQGDNLFLATDVSGAAITANPGSNQLGQILSKMLESSNVDLGEEMTAAMINQRDYQLSMRTFQQTDTMLGQTIAMRR